MLLWEIVMALWDVVLSLGSMEQSSPTLSRRKPWRRNQGFQNWKMHGVATFLWAHEPSSLGEDFTRRIGPPLFVFQNIFLCRSHWVSVKNKRKGTCFRQETLLAVINDIKILNRETTHFLFLDDPWATKGGYIFKWLGKTQRRLSEYFMTCENSMWISNFSVHK